MSDFIENKLKSVSVTDLEKTIAEAIASLSKGNVEVSISNIEFGSFVESTKLSITVHHVIEKPLL